MLLKDIVSLTLTLGCKNKEQPTGSTELDPEAGNLVKLKHQNLNQKAYLLTFGPKVISLLSNKIAMSLSSVSGLYPGWKMNLEGLTRCVATQSSSHISWAPKCTLTFL